MVKTQSIKKEIKVKKSKVKGKPIKKRRSSSLALKNKLIKKKKLWLKPRGGKGLVYLSHIPHGFYEDQIEAYFQQFGKVTGVSVPKSKSGKAKGYAFIEFQHPEVAEIAADTMNNYLMFNRVLKAKCIPPEEQKPRYLLAARAARLTHTTVPEKADQKITHNRKVKNRHLKTSLEAKLAVKLIRKSKALKRTLNNLGLDYEFQVEKGDVESVFKRKKELMEKMKSDSQNPTTEKENISTEDEDLLFSEEDEQDLSSLEDLDMLSEDENNANEIFVKTTKNPRMKNVKQSIKKKKEKQSKLLSKSNSKLISSSVNVKPKNLDKKLSLKKSQNRKEVSKSKHTMKTPLNTLTKNKLQKEESASAEKLSKVKRSIKHKKVQKLLLKSPVQKQNKPSKKNAALAKINENQVYDKTKRSPSVEPSQKQNKPPNNATVKHDDEKQKIQSQQRSKKEHYCLKTPKSGKKNQNISKKDKFLNTTPQTIKLQKIENVVMEVDKNDDEINFKTPPNVTKRFINTKKESSEKSPKGNKRPCLNTSKPSTSKVKSASPKKLRHRLLKRKSVA